jgi:raffinose/stachyose/melibiose transport system substrate-binding protein
LAINTDVSRRSLLRYAGLAGAAAVAGGALTACGSSSGSAGGSSGSTSLWLAFDDTAQQQYFQKSFVAKYNSTHKAQVELTVKQQATIENNVDLALSAGDAPDLVFSGGVPHALAYADAGHLRKLNSYATQYGWKNEFQPWALATSTEQSGSLWAMPLSYNSVVLFYNPATFAKHGWQVPKNQNDFEAICTEAAGKGMMPVAMCDSAKPVATGWYGSAHLNQTAGAEAVYQALQGKTPFTDPVFVDSITQFKGYFDKKWYAGGPQTFSTMTFDDIYTKIANGQAAMMIMLSWAFETMPPFFGSAAGNDATYTWAPLPPLAPHVASDSYVLAVGSALSISKKSANPDAAAAFMDWMISPARQMAAVGATIMPPVPVKVSASQFPAQAGEQVKSFYLALSSAKNVGYASWASFPPKCHTYMYTGLNDVIAGSLSPKAFCAELDSTFKSEQSSVPPLVTPTGGLPS